MELTLGCTTRPFAKLPFAEACQRIAAAGYTDVAVFGDVVGSDSSREEVLATRQVAQDAGLVPSMLLARAQLDLGPDEAVIIHEDKCIGCKFCVAVCPFGVVTLRKGGKVALKCDLCLLRTEEGLLPACVTACPTGAMKYLTAEELAKEKRRETAAKEYEASKPTRIKVQSEDG